MISYTAAIRQARAQALVAVIDSNPTQPGSIKLFAGPRPANPGLDPSGACLASIALQHPCASSIVDGVITLSDTPESLVDAGGVCSWARLVSGDGVVVGDMAVGLIGSGADIEIPSVGDLPEVHLIQGSYLRLVGATITEG